MDKNRSLFDRLARPAGALLVILFGFLGIAASLGMRESALDKYATRSGLHWFLTSTATRLENWFYDMRSDRFYQQNAASPHLVVVEIGDEILNKIGRWPWTRAYHAKILDNLAAYGAKVVMLDIAFPEPEPGGGDAAFAAAITRFTAGNKRSVVIGYDVTENKEDAVEKVPDELMLSAVTGRTSPKGEHNAVYVNRFNFSSPAILKAAPNYGFLSASPDLDGVFRYGQLVAEIDGAYYPSLGFSGYQAFYADGHDHTLAVNSLSDTQDYELLKTDGPQTVRTLLSPLAELKVRYLGTTNAFTHLNIEDIFFDKNPADNAKLKSLMNGKAVLIGSTAFGANDLRHTPVDAKMPGMYSHANIFHDLDQNYFFVSEEKSVFVSLALYFLGIAGVLALSRFHDPMTETLGAIGLAASLYAADYFYFAPRGYFIRLFFVLSGVVGLYAWFTVLNVFKEAKEKKRVRDAFSRYVAPEVVKAMLADPEKMKVGGEKKEITMLFSDVRDFTTISERLSAAELSTLLNIYMGRMTDILFDTGGTLDKYIGDALVGFWGAPLDMNDHAYQAVRGAKLMLEALPEINKEFERRKFPRINVGLGLNTGEVSVGNMGSDKIFQYTALGDNMNLASRLEGLTKHYGVNLMISEFTLERLGQRRKEFRLRPLDLVQVKGKSKAVKVYEVIPNWSMLAKEDAILEKYTDAYENKYLRRKFGEAIAIFEEILHLLPDDKASTRLKHNAEEFRAHPPPDDWDGVTVFTSK